jgi:hypothetical protein
VHQSKIKASTYISQDYNYWLHCGGAAPRPKPQVACPNRGLG